ncbi:HAD family hydrolase [Microbispora triticiradicis]|uniref:HAD family hydrolase n=2 Tax=Microbispora TaxID=2005 RepID=A0ABY3LS78_9ACTN|nr:MULTISPECIES: HAD family hydrolase [Microbispora]TLP54805.1 HAD family hydrolase [Microbispora fusca]TYB50730.1 HAD family hydrolase [Microbispora tritici]
MERRMIVCDLDGTLLDSHGLVSERTRLAVRRLHGAGHVFVIATARPVRDTRHVAMALGGTPIAICGNGSITFDFVRDEVVAFRPLTEAHVVEALAVLRDRFPGVRLGAECRLELVLEESFYVPPALSWTARRVPRLEEALDRRAVGKLMVQLDGTARHYYESVRGLLGGCEVTISADVFCEVMRAGVTKAAALELMAGSLGFAFGDVIAFGDMPNDLPMLTWAGTAVAVANAHPAVLASADEVTASNDDDGVAKWLERLTG